MRYLAPFLFAGALLAQDAPDPLRFVPADCEVVLRMRAPAAWGREFAGTGLGKALTSPDLAPKWKKLILAVGESSEIELEQREVFGKLLGVLGDYSGEIVAGFRIDWEDLDLGYNALAGALVVAFGPDPDSELGDLTERMLGVLPEPEESEIELGGQPVAVRRSGPWEIAGPMLREGCLVMVFATDLATQGRHFFEVREGAVPAMRGDVRKATLGMRIAIGSMIERLGAMPGDEGGVANVVRKLGAGSISDLTLTLFPDGKFVGQTMALDFNGSPRGLLDVVLPARRTRPTLLRYLPAGAQTYVLGPIDGGGLLDFYPRMFDLLADDLPMTREQLEEQFTAYTKLRLVDDVLALIGDEYMRIEDPSALVEYTDDMPEAVENAQDNFSNTCVVVRIKDGKAFGKNLDTAIRARGLHVSRKREQYGETTIYRLNLLGMFPVEYAVTDSLFVLGMGSSAGTKQNLRGVLDAVAAGDAEPVGFPAQVAERLDGLPENWSGIDVASLTEVIDGYLAVFHDPEVTAIFEDPDDDYADPWTAAYDLLKAMRPELARHGAATAVTVDYFTKTRYLSKSRW